MAGTAEAVSFNSAEAGIHHSDDSKGTRTWVDLVTDTALVLRGPRPMLPLPLVLLVACLAQARGKPCVTQNRLFIRHHVNNPRTPAPNPRAYCSLMRRRRRIYGKLINTFIHAPIQPINNVCFGGGTPFPSGLLWSKVSFTLTACIYNLSTCSYTGTYLSSRILISCCQGHPVYYEEQMLLPLTV
ncbi:ribonuclease-like [Dermochelys coriacea]|uniref:ribonuclease-like n=1 Tax=Dermochelys coriacea TaxID=27794 RepID=UPI001CA838BE|nr:ribonuclease-like [Dermochelys coriacea]